MRNRRVFLVYLVVLVSFALHGACADVINLVSPPMGEAVEQPTVALLWSYSPSARTLGDYGGASAKAFLKQVTYKVLVGWLPPDLATKAEGGYQLVSDDVVSLDKALAQTRIRDSAYSLSAIPGFTYFWWVEGYIKGEQRPIAASTIGTFFVGTRTKLAVPFTPVSPLYVDASKGSDSTGDGTPGNPFRTITRALDLASGRTILIAPGIYNRELGEAETLRVPAGTSLVGAGSTFDDVRVVAGLILGRGCFVTAVHIYAPIGVDGGGQVVLQSIGLSGSRASQIDGITCFEDSTELVVRDSLIEGWNEAIAIGGNGTSLTVTGCTIRASLAGVTVIGQGSPTATAHLVGNWISDCYSGVWILHGGNAVVENNKLFANSHGGVTVSGTLTGQVVMSRNLVMRNEVGLLLESAAIADLGGGPLGSEGANVFADNETNAIRDLRPPYSGTLYAVGNSWEGAMSGTLTGPAKYSNPAKCYIESEGNAIVFSK